MKYLLLILFSALSLTPFAQKREVPVNNFSELSFGVPGRLYLTQGDENKVVIDCSDATFDKLTFDERGRELLIRPRDRGWNWRGFGGRDITIYMVMKDIEAIALSGSGDLIGENEFKTGDLEVVLSGSGNLEIEAQSNDLDLKISGSGNIEMAGIARDVSARISGSGKIEAEKLKVRSLDAKISGSGNVYITAKEEIYASISGSGNVYYKGDPDRVQSNSSGSGKIRKM